MATKSDLEVLYQARGCQIGLVVQVYGKPEAILQRYYNAVKASGDPALSNLKFHRSPLAPEEELFIINAKKEPSNGKKL